MNKRYLAKSLGRLKEVLYSSFLPILYWSYHLRFALAIENKLGVPAQLRPIFMTTVLIAVSSIIYPLMQMIFSRCKLEVSFSEQNVGLVLEHPETKKIAMTVKFRELPWLGWLLVKQFRLTFNLIPSAEIVLVKCPDRKEKLKYTEMSPDGKLKVNFTRGVRSSNGDTAIKCPVMLQPQSNRGKVALKVESTQG